MKRDRYFFEIPIYRISHEKFDKGYENAFHRHWKNFIGASGLDPSQIQDSIRLHVKQGFWETYGGPWNYNQVIGWIRLYVLGSQLRGELWRMKGKQFHRKTRNQISLIGNAFEFYASPDMSSDDIRVEVMKELNTIQRGLKNQGRVLDLDCFLAIAPCVNWQLLMSIKGNEGQ
jgi:hypothetical protein